MIVGAITVIRPAAQNVPAGPGLVAGPAGQSAYQVWLAAGNTGPIGAYLASLVGPPGAASTVPGPPGAPSTVPGPANSLSIGPVATGAAGSSAAATITGSAPSQTLNLTIPKGDLGGAGPANSLAIGSVSTGSAGSSAAATITGSAPSQTLNLTLPKGDPGAIGGPGPANTLAIGTVATGAAGSPAAASVSGASPNQTLSLTIPQGGQGTTGAAGPQPWQTPPVAWAASTAYTATAPASVVTYAGGCYVCSTGHTSTSSFDATKWTQIAAPGSTTAALTRGYISALALANNTSDATNDIDIAPGKARDGTDAIDLILTASLTKQLDAAWAAGTNAGGRDTGSLTDGTWHVWLIGRTDGTARDVLYSLSATAPTMPSGYTYKRRIGSILRVSGAIKPFLQSGDEFRVAQVQDLYTTAGRALSLLALSVPTGVVVRPLFVVVMQQGAGGDITASVAPGANSALTSYLVNSNLGSDRQLNTGIAPATNTNAQIYIGIAVGSGNLSGFLYYTAGWIDRRGQDD